MVGCAPLRAQNSGDGDLDGILACKLQRRAHSSHPPEAMRMAAGHLWVLPSFQTATLTPPQDRQAKLNPGAFTNPSISRTGGHHLPLAA